MTKNRLEAFSDGVLAIIITIMVLEIKVPHSVDLGALKKLYPVLLSYILSFVYIAIYWNNHHHLLHTVKKVNGKILWANLILLFCLSLIPFATGWMGENHFALIPVAFYGVMLLLSAMAYYHLQNTIIRYEGKDSLLAKAVGKDYKGKISIVAYVTALIFVFFLPVVSEIIYVLIALMWFIPDKRIEKMLNELE